jgi:hypothetical protein
MHGALGGYLALQAGLGPSWPAVSQGIQPEKQASQSQTVGQSVVPTCRRWCTTSPPEVMINPKLPLSQAVQIRANTYGI